MRHKASHEDALKNFDDFLEEIKRKPSASSSTSSVVSSVESNPGYAQTR
jgi:hypothetical protein